MNIGRLGTVQAGETRSVPLSFSPFLADGESIVVIAGLESSLYKFSELLDPNAGNLIIPGTQISGKQLLVPCGGRAPLGFQPGVIYTISGSVLTNLDQIITVSGQIECNIEPVVEAVVETQQPGTTTPLSEDTTITAPGIYELVSPNLTITLPSAWASTQWLVIADVIHSPWTIVGNIVNFPAGSNTVPLPADSSVTLSWSSSESGWILL